MFSCSRKDKRLSSAKKRLMSQLGKGKRRTGNSSGELSATHGRQKTATKGDMSLQSTTYQDVAGLKDDTSQSAENTFMIQ